MYLYFTRTFFSQPLPHITLTVLKLESFPPMPLPKTANEVGMTKKKKTFLIREG